MPESNCKALLIGNSVFEEDPHNLPELKGPINDVALLRDALTDPDLGLFAPENVRLLPERNKREIATVMEEFFRNAGRDDVLLLYYSGHGKQDEYDNLYLCARDTRTDLLVSTGISDVEISGIMRASSARTFIVILDCCHSGAFKGGGLPTHLRGSGRFVLTSSRRGQLSVDSSAVSGPSLFTRHLAEALTLGTLDDNDDGFVSLNEVYNYVLERLGEESKQIPQRHFDNTVGDPPLARSRRGTPGPVPRLEGAPVLEISESEIVIRDVQADEVLPAEIVDVFNKGGGTLDWTVESDADWIRVEPEAGFFRMLLTPRPGVNRGNVRVRDRGAGGSRTVRVVVHALARPQPPKLQLSDPALDFGVLSHGVESPRRTVTLVNVGGGELRARAWTQDPWIDVHHFGDSVSALVDTSVVGRLEGAIHVESEGGNALVQVRAVVEPGPLLAVEPKVVDFGRVWAGRPARASLRVTNAGKGALQWNWGMQGDFFSVQRGEEGLVVDLRAGPGGHLGSIWVGSNGGQATVDVRAEVVAPTPPRRVTPGAGGGSGVGAGAAARSGAGARPGAGRKKRRLGRRLVVMLLAGLGVLSLVGLVVSAFQPADSTDPTVLDATFDRTTDSVGTPRLLNPATVAVGDEVCLAPGGPPFFFTDCGGGDVDGPFTVIARGFTFQQCPFGTDVPLDFADGSRICLQEI